MHTRFFEKINSDNPSTTTTAVQSTVASTNATVPNQGNPDDDQDDARDENEETTFTSTTTTSATTSATTTTTSTTTTTTTTTSTTTTTLPAIESGAPLIEYLQEANGKGKFENWYGQNATLFLTSGFKNFNFRFEFEAGSWNVQTVDWYEQRFSNLKKEFWKI